MSSSMDEQHWRHVELFALLRGLLGPELLHGAPSAPQQY